MSDLCKEFGVSRKTAYKWCNRYKRFGEPGLKDLSKAPKQPNKLYTAETLSMAIDLKLKKSKNKNILERIIAEQELRMSL